MTRFRRSAEAVCTRPRRARDGRAETRRPSSCRSRQQLGQADQVERRAGEDEEPVDVREAAQFDFAHPGDGLQPPERRFDARPRVLTLRVARVPGRAPIDRAAAAPREVLRHVRRGAPARASGRRSRTCRSPCPRRRVRRRHGARCHCVCTPSASPPRARQTHRRSWPSHRQSTRGDSQSAGGPRYARRDSA